MATKVTRIKVLVIGSPQFRKSIPNGDRIPSPCNRSEIWPAVGHQGVNRGPLNEFGKAFLANKKSWTIQLCQADSDGDGKTNGEELGDPDCTWKLGMALTTNTSSSALSHPGICEPINATKCHQKNNFLRSIESRQQFFVTNNNTIATTDTTNNNWCPAIKAAGVKMLTLRFNETRLPLPNSPGERTVHYCQNLHIPSGDGDYHIIAWEPYVTSALNQIIVYICDSPPASGSLIAECGLFPASTCRSSSIFWSLGMTGRCLSDDAGMAFGNRNQSVILQLRYDIALLKAKQYQDKITAVNLYYTPTKRRYDIAQLLIGQNDIAVPPQSPLTTIMGRAFQSKSCSQQLLSKNKAYSITAVMFRMNKYGKMARLLLEKANGDSITIVDEADYNYLQPKIMTWQPDIATILTPGDNLVIECSYQTLRNNNVTRTNEWTFYGKNSTKDEICSAVLEVYPPPIETNNYLDLTSLGLNDQCMIEQANRDRIQPCQADKLASILSSIANSTDELLKYCNNPTTTPAAFSLSKLAVNCWMFVAPTNLLSYPCVYSASYEVVKQLVIDSNRNVTAATVANVYANILSCTNAFQHVNTLESSSDTKNSASSPLQIINTYYYFAMIILVALKFY